MNYKIILTAALVLLAIFVWASSNRQAQSFKTVSVSEFAAIIADTTAIQLLDVRTLKEFDEGHIAGALQIDFYSDQFLPQTLAKLSKEKTIAIYCRSGRRSASAAEKLAAEGYQLINLAGGILAWQQAQMPLEK